MALTLKAWRKVRDLSQEKMAERLGVHVNTYINWENDPKKMSIEKSFQACEILNVNFDDVLFLPDNATEM